MAKKYAMRAKIGSANRTFDPYFCNASKEKKRVDAVYRADENGNLSVVWKRKVAKGNITVTPYGGYTTKSYTANYPARLTVSGSVLVASNDVVTVRVVINNQTKLNLPYGNTSGRYVGIDEGFDLNAQDSYSVSVLNSTGRNNASYCNIDIVLDKDVGWVNA